MAHLVSEGKLSPEKLDTSYGAWKNHISHGNCYHLGRDMDRKIQKEVQTDAEQTMEGMSV